MSREEVTSFLLNLQLSIRELDKDIDKALTVLPEVKKEDLPKWLEDEVKRILRVQQDLMNDWDALTKSSQEISSQQRSPHRIDADRLRRLGAVPALGGDVVLPKSTSKDITSLTATASPAAVDILRSKLDNASSPLKSTTTTIAGDGEDEEPRHQTTTTTTTQPFENALRPTTKDRLEVDTSPASELAIALQKRLHIQQQQVGG
jgi:hypothetical protein